jgi:hypothetical protein
LADGEHEQLPDACSTEVGVRRPARWWSDQVLVSLDKFGAYFETLVVKAHPTVNVQISDLLPATRANAVRRRPQRKGRNALRRGLHIRAYRFRRYQQADG